MTKPEAYKKAGRKRKVFLSKLPWEKFNRFKIFIAEGDNRNKNRRINMLIMRSCGSTTYFVRCYPWLRWAADQT